MWQANDAIPFKQITGLMCHLVVTTRFVDVANLLANTPNDLYWLEVLADEAALELLTRLAPTTVKQHPKQSRQLVADLEGLPLAIRVAGRTLETEASIGSDKVLVLLDELRASSKLLEHLAPDDRFDSKTGTTPTISLLLKRSTDRLDSESRDCFARLGGFAPRPATFDKTALKAIWKISDPMPTIHNLVDCGLLEPIISTGRFQMHSVLVMHARSLLA